MSTSTAPDPCLDQRMRAIDRANEIRLARAGLKHKIAAGEVFAASVILDPPEEAKSWEVGELLLAQKRWGEVRMRKFLSRLMIRETKPAGMLTGHQRLLIAQALGQTESEDA